MEEQKAFKLVAPYQPTGDQPQAIDALVKGLEHGDNGQVLLGVTGSGKTFTMANVIQKINRPTLVLAHNKILAAQLCSEFKEFFHRVILAHITPSCQSSFGSFCALFFIPTIRLQILHELNSRIYHLVAICKRTTVVYLVVVPFPFYITAVCLIFRNSSASCN